MGAAKQLSLQFCMRTPARPSYFLLHWVNRKRTKKQYSYCTRLRVLVPYSYEYGTRGVNPQEGGSPVVRVQYASRYGTVGRMKQKIFI